jgi:hypothetical protein
MRLLLLLSLLFSTQVFGNSFLNGCYKTLEINDRPVIPGPDESRQSSIFSLEQNEFYYDVESGKSLKTQILSFFTGHRDGWYSYVNAVLFDTLGEMTVTDNSMQYSFDKTVLHRNSSYGYDEVDFTTYVELYKFRGIVSGHIKQRSVALNRNINLNVVMKEIPCQD